MKIYPHIIKKIFNMLFQIPEIEKGGKAAFNSQMNGN
jgi:hypothetical protein